MNKAVVILIVISCFIFYGVLPLATSLLVLWVSDDSTLAKMSVVIWAIVVLIQLAAIWTIINRNPKGLHWFFLMVFLYVFLYAGDEMIVFFEGEDSTFPLFSILNKAIYPLLAVWTLYFSDAKDFFNRSIESE